MTTPTNDENPTVEVHVEEPKRDTVAHRLAQGAVAFRDMSPTRRAFVYLGVAAINPAVGLTAAGADLGYSGSQGLKNVRTEIEKIEASKQ